MSRGLTRWIRRRALQLCFLLALLLPAEIFARWLQASRESRQDTINGAYMPIRLKPDFDGIVGGQHFSTNNLGFREAPPLDLDAPLQGRRILVLGDSISFGFGLPVEETYPAVLGRLLAADDPSSEVLNAAGQGYSPSSYWAYAFHDGLRLEPETVIVQVEPSNDVSDEAFLWVRTDPAGTPEVGGGRYLVAWDGNLLGSVVLGPYGYEKTYLYNLFVRNLLNGIETYAPPPSGLEGASFTYFSIGPDRLLLSRRRIEQGWNRFFSSLIHLQELVNRRGVKLLVLVIPNRFLFETSSQPAESHFAVRNLERSLKTLEEAGLETIDVRNPLAEAGGSSLYLDFAHLNREGQEILAGSLRDRLRN